MPLCLVRSGRQNAGKQRAAAKSSVGLSHRPRRAKFLAPPQKKSSPPLLELLSCSPHRCWGWCLPREGSWASCRVANLVFAAEHLAGQQTWFLGEGWAAPGKCPLLCGKAVPWAGGRLSRSGTAGYRSPNQREPFLLCQGTMLLSSAGGEASGGSPALGRLSKCATGPRARKSIWRIENQNGK